MEKNTKTNILASVIFLVLDLIWIYGYMGTQYQGMIQRIQKSEMVPNVGSAIVAYILLVVGLWVFVLPSTSSLRNINNQSNQTTLTTTLRAFIFGIVVYGLYDFTAGTVLTDFDFRLALIDVMWGGGCCALSTFLSMVIVKN